MGLLETIKNFVHTACLSVLLILIGVAALWAVGAYYQVEAPKMHGGETTRMEVELTENNYSRSIDTSGEEWHPISNEVGVDIRDIRNAEDVFARLKQRVSDLEALVAEQKKLLDGRGK